MLPIAVKLFWDYHSCINYALADLAEADKTPYIINRMKCYLIALFGNNIIATPFHFPTIQHNELHDTIDYTNLRPYSIPKRLI